nr:MAG TPA: hypothetical protein [Caudoviricetes sp.]
MIVGIYVYPLDEMDVVTHILIKYYLNSTARNIITLPTANSR